MPVYVDLAQFPQLLCRRCGLVALVDPGLAPDLHSSLRCPNCRLRLSPPRLARDPTSAPPAGAAAPEPASRISAGPVPSNAVVGLTIAALFMVLLLLLFVYLALTPHRNYFEYLTKP